MITVKGEAEAKKLCASGLRFGGVVGVVERYWEAGPSSVCMKCCGIGHERMGSCGDRPLKCVICCGVTGCKRGKGKICVHVNGKCAKCGGGHVANSSRCASRHKADVKARKEKKIKEKGDKEHAHAHSDHDEAEDERREESPLVNTDMDLEMELEGERWAQSSETETSWANDGSESQHRTQDYKSNKIAERDMGVQSLHLRLR